MNQNNDQDNGGSNSQTVSTVRPPRIVTDDITVISTAHVVYDENGNVVRIRVRHVIDEVVVVTPTPQEDKNPT